MLKRFMSPRGILTVAFLAASPSVAMAYIDPGNGAYMVQALFTLLGAALFYVRHPIRTAKLIWNRVRGRGGEDEAAAEQESFPEGASAANDRAMPGTEGAGEAAVAQKQQG
jgi:hypothetical protein